MSVFSFEGYGEFSSWCEENGYDPDEQYDLEEGSFKRNTIEYFYIKKLNEDKYAEVNVTCSYDNGWGYGNVEKVGLVRTEEQIVTTKVSYV